VALRDAMSGSEWDRHDWLRQPEARKKLFQLAAEGCLAL